MFGVNRIFEKLGSGKVILVIVGIVSYKGRVYFYDKGWYIYIYI